VLGALAGRQTPQAGPVVIVLPFEPLAGGEGDQLLANGISAGLMADLRRFDGLQVCAGLPESQGGAGAAGTR
jgi:TolB-like protein